MKQRATRHNNKRERDHTYWQQIVENRLPLVGPWFREIAVKRLAQEAELENQSAVNSLALAVDNNPDPRVREIATQAIGQIERAGVINSAWDAWLIHRGPALERLLIDRGKVASSGLARIYSCLLLDKLSLLTKSDCQQIGHLLSACEDSNPILREKARSVLPCIKHKDGINAICAAWAAGRQDWLDQTLLKASYLPEPVDLRVLVQLRRDQFAEPKDEQVEYVYSLIKFTRDQDPEIAVRAENSLRDLQKPTAQDGLCAIWAETRLAILESIIIEKGWIASQPENVRLLTALKIENTGFLSNMESVSIETLLEIARTDEDIQIRERAVAALQKLSTTETQEEICRLFVDQAHPIARIVVLAGGFRPVDAASRALFLFLAEQWNDYAALDFDGRILRTHFLGSNPGLRKRITQCVQKSGRIDFLQILVGSNDKNSSLQLSGDETRLFVQMLTQDRQWERLWKLALEMPLPASIDTFRLLVEKGWRPEADDLPLYTHLQTFLQGTIVAEPEDVRRLLPPLQASAIIRVHGRVNDLAFSPIEPTLAIGTGQRNVVIWNYQQGKTEYVIKGFNHSVGKVTYDELGRLFIAERTNTGATCSLYMWQGGNLIPFGSHSASITAMTSVSKDWVVSAGRDRNLVTWDVNSRKKLFEASIPLNQDGFVRDLVLSPGKRNAMLLQSRIGILSVPDLENYRSITRTGSSPEVEHSVPKCGTIVDGEDEIIIGQHNGQVVWYRPTSHHGYWNKTLLAEHALSVRGIEYVESRNLLISAGSEGGLKLIPWPNRKPVETVTSPLTSLTALKVSTNGAFVATGYANRSMILWDLRVRDLPDLLSKPMICGTPADLNLIEALSNGTNYPQPVMRVLNILKIIIQHHLRYAVQVSDLPTLRPGEFDIVLE